jgi:hypothetical protein
MAAENRKLLISLAQRRQRPGTGSSRAFLFERTANLTWPDLSGILHGVLWAVAGAVAARHYMPERATRDLDVVVAAEDSPRVQESLRSAGYRFEGHLTIGGSAWKSPEGIEVDVLELSAEWTAVAISASQGNRDLQGLPILPLPYLVLLKLGASRPQDLADLARMLGQADDAALAEVRAVAALHARADLEDLESLIELGRLELQDG